MRITGSKGWGVVLALAAVLLIATAAPLAARPAGQEPGASVAARININAAGVEELMTLPGIGKAYAERIVEYRQKNGPFRKPEDLLNVRGVGEKTFQRIKDRITVGKS